MRTLRHVNIKNRQNYFFNTTMTNIKNFDQDLLSIDQVSFKGTDFFTYHIEYFKNLQNGNSLYLVFNDVGPYNFCFYRQEQRSIRKLHRIWDEIKDQIDTISGNKLIEYEKDFRKIKFESDDDLLSIPVCIIIVRSVFQENNNYYPQVFFMNVFVSMNMNLRMVLIALYK